MFNAAIVHIHPPPHGFNQGSLPTLLEIFSSPKWIHYALGIRVILFGYFNA